MIRPFTVVCMLGAVGSGLYLYQCKHQAQVLDREITRTLRQTDAARDRIGMLRAEWTQLNEPERVADQARAHTNLQIAKPTQFTTVADLAAKLPAPAAPHAPTQSTDLPDVSPEAPAMPVAQAAPHPAPEPAKPEARPTARAVAAADPRPAKTEEAKPADTRTADAKPAETKPVRHPAASTTGSTPVSTPAVTQVAATHPIARPVRAAPMPAVDADATAPGTVGAAVLRAMRAREAAATPAPYVRPAMAPVEPTRYAPPAYSAPAPAYAPPPANSALGGRGSALPPPVPFAAR